MSVVSGDVRKGHSNILGYQHPCFVVAYLLITTLMTFYLDSPLEFSNKMKIIEKLQQCFLLKLP